MIYWIKAAVLGLISIISSFTFGMLCDIDRTHIDARGLQILDLFTIAWGVVALLALAFTAYHLEHWEK